MRICKPNEHGVFCDAELTETIKHKTPSGAIIEIDLAYTTEGWRSSLSFSRGDEYSGGLPSVWDRPHPDRQAATNERLSELTSICNRHIACQFTSEKKRAQVSEALDWIAQQNQISLF